MTRNRMRFPNRWTVGPWTFYEAMDHGFTGSLDGQPIYGFTITAEEKTDDHGAPRVGEWYTSLDHAMVAAVGEKHTGPRGAGGRGVGTAADWFMKMIGAGELQAAGDEGRMALGTALQAAEVTTTWKTGRVIEDALETQGYTIARHAR